MSVFLAVFYPFRATLRCNIRIHTVYGCNGCVWAGLAQPTHHQFHPLAQVRIILITKLVFHIRPCIYFMPARKVTTCLEVIETKGK